MANFLNRKLPIDFFDEAEIIDVLEARAPFRHYPGNPLKTKTFESECAKYTGAKYTLGVNSGTAALDCAVAALEIGPGDEVIIPAFSWWSDYTCVLLSGALPVFVDMDYSIGIDPEDFARKITPRTKAVIPVHTEGGHCDMEPIMKIARKHGIAVVEDAAQSVGGSYRGKKLGTIGEAGIFSFQVCKIISSGEGGLFLTDDPKLYERAVRYHDLGLLRNVFHERIGESHVEAFGGQNLRMSEFTSAVLNAQLSKLDTIISGLRRSADAVIEGIKDLPGINLRVRPNPKGDLGYGVFFALENKSASDRCIQELRKRKIPAGRMSQSTILPVHSSVISKQARHPNWPSFITPAGKKIKYGAETCQQTLNLYNRFVRVRMGPKYTDKMIDRIIEAIREVYPMVT